MNSEDFVTYEQAKILKEIGFDWECNHYYLDTHKTFHDKGYFADWNIDGYGVEIINERVVKDFRASAPTLAQAQKWMREVKGMHLWVESEPNEFHGEIMYVFYILDENRWLYPSISGERCHNTYEEALSEAINKAIDLLRTN